MKADMHTTFGEFAGLRHTYRRCGSMLIVGLVVVLAFGNQAFAQGQGKPPNNGVQHGQGLGPFDFTGDLRNLPKADMQANARHEGLRPKPAPAQAPGAPQGGPPDPLLIYSAPSLPSPAPFTPPPFVDFDGMAGGNPPDTNGVVGPNHYIQTINVAYQIWDKAGTVLAGPTAFTTLFAAAPATNTPCDSGFTSDPVVLYDPLADRFVLTILAFEGFEASPPAPPRTPIPPFYECIAVSKTADPVSGGWFKYALLADPTSLNDFPKLAVWPDAYYMSANMYPTSGDAFPRVWALDRNSILVGGLMHEVHFDVPVGYWSLLPANMHGTSPPAGAPNVFAAVNSNNDDKVFLWNFHVDFVTPANSTFGDGSHNPDHTVTVAAYTHLSQNIPQPGTTVVSLDALGDRLNYPAQYRNIGGTQSLWLDHPVDTGGNVSGIRWYEIHDPGGSPTLFQQGTWNNLNDGVQRWMGAIGADQFGNMAIGYNVSNATSVFPGIRYAGRVSADPLGLLGLGGEMTLIAGTSNIINCTPDATADPPETTCVGRWGDYSGMSVDPVDDCTFWFTGEYVTGGTNRTRIGAFAMPGCDADVSVIKSAPSTVAAGTNLSYSITVANAGPVTAQFVALSDTTPPNTTFVGLAQTAGPTFTCTTPAVGGTGVVNCGIAALADGASATFTLVVKVDPGAAGPIVNTAIVDSQPLDPNPGNNTSTVSTVVIQSADLSVTKTCKPDTVQVAGAAAFCDIVVTNLGPSAAQNVVLTDTIISNASFTVTSATAAPIPCNPPIATPIGPTTSATLTCNLGTLAAGAVTTFHVEFSSKSAADINDTATVTSRTPDPNTANNTATGHVSFGAAADLALTKTAAPNPVIAGTNLTYTINVSNAGPSDAANVVVKDTVPADVAVLTITPSVGSCTAGIPGNPLQPITCTLGTILAGGNASVVVVVKVSPSVPDGTVLNNSATVTSSAADVNNANNSATAAVTVRANADLAIVKTADQAQYRPSSEITYTVMVTNLGPSDALAVVVTDNLPTVQQAIYQSDTGGCTRNLQTPTLLTCSLDNMPVGASRSFNVYELVRGSRGEVSNTASVTSATTDPVAGNNSSTVIVTVGH